MKQVIEHEGFRIEVTVRANCRRMVLRGRNGESGFSLSVPKGSTRREIERFLSEHDDWIRKVGSRMQVWQPRCAPGERHMALGQRVELGRDGVPAGADFLRWRSGRLLEVVKRLLPILEARMGVRAQKLRFREMKSRWGSCNTKTGCVTLNTNLAKYPEECIECVLVHELCHFHCPDHSARFHSLMTLFLPSWREREKRMNTLDARALPPEEPEA